jgi:hypothetical protein
MEAYLRVPTKTYKPGEQDPRALSGEDRVLDHELRYPVGHQEYAEWSAVQDAQTGKYVVKARLSDAALTALRTNEAAEVVTPSEARQAATEIAGGEAAERLLEVQFNG